MSELKKIVKEEECSSNIYLPIPVILIQEKGSLIVEAKFYPINFAKIFRREKKTLLIYLFSYRKIIFTKYILDMVNSLLKQMRGENLSFESFWKSFFDKFLSFFHYI